MMFYIYKITNKCNGKIYVGLHKSTSLTDTYMGSGKLIKAAIKKYGKENFIKEILEIFDNELDAIKKEEEIVTAEFVLNDNNYNIMPGGKFGSLDRNGLSFKDRKHTKETIEKIRNKRKGKTASLAAREKMSKNNFSKTNPEKQREHARKAASYPRTEEHKKKISNTLKLKNLTRVSHNVGKIRTKIECPHCNKTGANNTMSRWHFDKCKTKKF